MSSLKVGISGHQHREGIDWAWVRNAIRIEFGRLKDVEKVLSSLAVGSDQIFAEVALELGIPVVCVIPMPNYERHFDGRALLDFRRLLGQSEPFQLNWNGDSERAFFEAGKFIVESCNVLIVVWDGRPTEGLGGTGDVVAYARQKNCRIVHINPIDRKISRTASS
ncbi:hypothetical protein AB7714_01175 [Tardiphaga sp. 1201_B9_N1_1]|uniref:hypothetical protein n=1 Tax=unclassified Tardiphaga TaxID=2631404 RepID=UPI003F286505